MQVSDVPFWPPQSGEGYATPNVSRQMTEMVQTGPAENGS
jgi:hypothetical protein